MNEHEHGKENALDKPEMPSLQEIEDHVCCCDPVGPVDIAERSSYSAATVNRWVARGVFGEAPHTVSGGSAWPWAMARRVLIETGRCYVDDDGALQRTHRAVAASS